MNQYDDIIEPPDVATWNFPNGRTGVFTTFIKLSDTFAGARLRLNDQLYWNSDGYYSNASIMTPQFGLEISPSGELSGSGLETSQQRLSPGTWYKLQLAWDLDNESCSVWLNGQNLGSLQLGNPTPNGLSYIRFESTADNNTPDANGFYIRSVDVRVRDTP